MPPKQTTPETTRLTLTLPTTVYDELATLAMHRQGATPQELVRSFIRLGLLVVSSNEDTANALSLVLRQGDQERTVFLL